jgi:hypothetical protein
MNSPVAVWVEREMNVRLSRLKKINIVEPDQIDSSSLL